MRLKLPKNMLIKQEKDLLCFAPSVFMTDPQLQIISFYIARYYVKKHNRLNVGRIALERLVGALIKCSLFELGGGGNGTKKFRIY